MNIFYSFPVFIPISSDSNLDIDPKTLWAILIVTNLIWLFVFIIALIHNAIINKREKYKKESLEDRGYFFVTSLMCSGIDAVAIFIALVCWVETLL